MKLADGLLLRSDYVPGDPYGMRFHPIEHVYKVHDGVDIKTYKEKWPIYSLEHGIVENTGYHKLIGKFIRIVYRRIGLVLYLYHLDDVLVKKGQRLIRGALMGHVGTTGASTGIHLHLGVKRIGNDKWIDPNSIDYFSSENTRLIEDGILGPETLYKLQVIYNQFPDCRVSGQRNTDLVLKFKPLIQPGINGSNLFKSIQKDLGLKQDGLCGPNTIGAMQRATNTPITRKLLKENDPAILEIQKRINNKERLWGS